MLIIGEKEVDNQSVNIRRKNKGVIGDMCITDFRTYFQEQLEVII